MSVLTTSGKAATIDWSGFKPSVNNNTGQFIGSIKPHADNLTKPVTMDIKQVLPTIETFADLRPIVENADVHLSFWGSRYVTVRGFEGYLLLDDLPEHIFLMLHRRPNSRTEEMNHGVAIQDKINILYDKSDEQVYRGNPFTWAIVRIFELGDELYHMFYLKHWTTRFSWRGCGVSVW